MAATHRARPAPLVRASILLGAVAVLAGLTGCMPKPAPPTLVTPTSAAGPSITPTPSVTAKPAGEPWTPVTIACVALLTSAQLSQYNATFTPDPDYKPVAGTDAETIATGGGTVCGWKNPAGGTMEIAVGQPPETKLTALNNIAIGVSHAVPTYGIPPEVWGYFSREGDWGEAQVFQSGRWVVWRSAAFLEPGDPAPLVAAVQANLPTD